MNPNKKKITVIGAGSWGSALARILGDNQNEVLLYDKDSVLVEEINQYHTNKTKLPIGMLPQIVKATTDINQAISYSDIIVLSIPTKVLRHHRTIRRRVWRCLFRHLRHANFSIYRQ